MPAEEEAAAAASRELRVGRPTRLGLSVTPALGLTSRSITSGNALAHVAEVAVFAKVANVSGLMLDFEPRAPYTPSESAYQSC